MKKFFPMILMFSFFCLFLIGQILYEKVNIKAGVTTSEIERNQSYNYSFKSLTKHLHGDSSYQDAPIVILNFWASWCVPCLAEFDSLKNLETQFNANELFIIGINNDEKETLFHAQKTLDKFNITWPQIYDFKGTVSSEFFVEMIPYSIIFVYGSVYEVAKGIKDFSDPHFILELKEILSAQNK